MAVIGDIIDGILGGVRAGIAEASATPTRTSPAAARDVATVTTPTPIASTTINNNSTTSTINNVISSFTTSISTITQSLNAAASAITTATSRITESQQTTATTINASSPPAPRSPVSTPTPIAAASGPAFAPVVAALAALTLAITSNTTAIQAARVEPAARGGNPTPTPAGIASTAPPGIVSQIASVVAPAASATASTVAATVNPSAIQSAIQAPIAPVAAIGNALADTVGKANPAAVERFNLVLADTQASIGKIVMPAFEAIIPLGKAIGDSIASFEPVLKPAFESIGALMGALAENVKPLAAVLSPVVSLFARVVSTVADGLSAIAKAAKPFLEATDGILNRLGVGSKSTNINQNADITGAAVREVQTLSISQVGSNAFDAALRAGFGQSKDAQVAAIERLTAVAEKIEGKIEPSQDSPTRIYQATEAAKIR